MANSSQILNLEDVNSDEDLQEWVKGRLNLKFTDVSQFTAKMVEGDHVPITPFLKNLFKKLHPEYFDDMGSYHGSSKVLVKTSLEDDELTLEIHAGIHKIYSTKPEIRIDSSHARPFIDFHKMPLGAIDIGLFKKMLVAKAEPPDLRAFRDKDQTQAAYEYGVSRFQQEIVSRVPLVKGIIPVDPSPGTITRLKPPYVRVTEGFVQSTYYYKAADRAAEISCKIVDYSTENKTEMFYLGFYGSEVLYPKAFGFIPNPYSMYMKVSGKILAVSERPYGYDFKYIRKNEEVTSRFSFFEKKKYRYQTRYSQTLFRAFNPQYSGRINDSYILYANDPSLFQSFFEGDVPEAPAEELCPVGIVNVSEYDSVVNYDLNSFHLKMKVPVCFAGDSPVDVKLPFIISDRMKILRKVCRENDLPSPCTNFTGDMEHPISGVMYYKPKVDVGYNIEVLGVVRPKDIFGNSVDTIKNIDKIDIEGVTEIVFEGTHAFMKETNKVAGFRFTKHDQGRWVKVRGFIPTLPVYYSDNECCYYTYVEAGINSVLPSFSLMNWYYGLKTGTLRDKWNDHVIKFEKQIHKGEVTGGFGLNSTKGKFSAIYDPGKDSDI